MNNKITQCDKGYYIRKDQDQGPQSSKMSSQNQNVDLVLLANCTASQTVQYASPNPSHTRPKNKL